MIRLVSRFPPLVSMGKRRRSTAVPTAYEQSFSIDSVLRSAFCTFASSTHTLKALHTDIHVEFDKFVRVVRVVLHPVYYSWT